MGKGERIRRRRRRRLSSIFTDGSPICPNLGGISLCFTAGKKSSSFHSIHFSENGPYWVNTPSGKVETFCDLENGGWTLIGQTSGSHGQMYEAWLRQNHNPANLRTPVIEANDYSCIDAVNMAVNHAKKVSKTPACP